MMTVFTQEQATALLADLIQIRSVNDDEVQVADYLQQLFAGHGIAARVLPLTGNRANLIAEIGRGEPVLAFSGHMDVVAPGNGWHTDPFHLTTREGTFYGRGVADMKAGLAAMVIAMIELHAQGLPKRGTIRLLATAGEEVGEAGSAWFAAQGDMADVAGLIVGEPSSIAAASAAEKGSYDIEFTSKGQAAHSSMPENGANALLPLMQFLVQAEAAFAQVPAGKMGPLRFNVDVCHGGEQVNSLPDSATALVNVRTIPEFNNDQVTEKLADLLNQANAAGAQISMRALMNEWPIATAADNRLLQLVTTIGAKYAHQPVQTGPTPGITDASNLVKGKPEAFPFVIYGPGNATMHQADESLPAAMYFDFIAVYQELALAFLDQG
jgi:succinyl-diaminopimelate desuccinylase